VLIVGPQASPDSSVVVCKVQGSCYDRVCESYLVPRRGAAYFAAGRGSKWPKASCCSARNEIEVPQRRFFHSDARITTRLFPCLHRSGASLRGELVAFWWSVGKPPPLGDKYDQVTQPGLSSDWETRAASPSSAFTCVSESFLVIHNKTSPLNDKM
jgi:hypothetical protein